MNTIAQLEAWLEDNCYSFQELTIGSHHAPEGIVIEAGNGAFHWSYSERGQKNILASFDTEKELVDYALGQLTADKWARAHLLAFTLDETMIKDLGALLTKMHIAFERNDIPQYQSGKCAYRIFVFGRDIKKVRQLKKKYLYR